MLLLKVPNVIKVEPLPYDPDQTDIEPEEVYDNGKKRLRANDINVIRWRYRWALQGVVCWREGRSYLGVALEQRASVVGSCAGTVRVSHALTPLTPRGVEACEYCQPAGGPPGRLAGAQE